jgi:hypothetical protein
MKKIIAITIFAFIAASLVFVSCKKDNISTIENAKSSKPTRLVEDYINFNQINYTISDGILKFSSLEEYENLFGNNTQPETEVFSNLVLGSPAIKTYYSTLDASNPQKGSLKFIGCIVNSDKIIKIGEFLILLDFESNYVYAETDGTLTNLNKAKNGEQVAGVYKFDMGEDVIEELKLKKTRGLFCGAPWCIKGNKKVGGISIISSGNVGFDLFENIAHPFFLNGEYEKYGIWFQYIVRDVCSGFPIDQMSGPRVTSGSGQFTRRCGNTVTNTINLTSSLPFKHGLLYGNIRSLSKLDATITMTTTSPGSGSPTSITLHDVR